MTRRYSTDIVVFGGGVTGLWLLQRLRQQGYHALLLEAGRLGGGQTLASQGIIHGGLKYALGGRLTNAVQAIAHMPARWRQSLRGEAMPDLSAVSVLSEQYYMWSDGNLRSRLKSFLGSKSLRGRVEALAPPDYPEFFSQATGTGQLYRLPDFVVDPLSLVRTLAAPVRDALFHIQADCIGFSRDDSGRITAATVYHTGNAATIEAQRFVFAAGAGNRKLIQAAGLAAPLTQERPLHMVYVSGTELPPAYVHCVGDNFSLSPRLTVTSHPDASGGMVWYLGGELAETGIHKSQDEQIAAARELTGDLFPWVDFRGARWEALMINRAEPKLGNLPRPDDACVVSEGTIIIAWPFKLTLAPVVADKVLAQLTDSSVTPAAATDLSGLRPVLPEPDIADTPWRSA